MVTEQVRRQMDAVQCGRRVLVVDIVVVVAVELLARYLPDAALHRQSIKQSTDLHTSLKIKIAVKNA